MVTDNLMFHNNTVNLLDCIIFCLEKGATYYDEYLYWQPSSLSLLKQLRRIKTKNDALLNIKNEHKFIRDHCQYIIKDMI